MKTRRGGDSRQTTLAALIKSRVSLPEVIARYAPAHSPRNGRIPCPIHGGENYNFGFTDDIYHCFVCGCRGDLISFVRDMFGLNCMDAIRKLDGDFNLNLPIGRRRTLREIRDEQRALAAREKARADKLAAEKAEKERYWAILEKVIQCERDIVNFAPEKPEDTIHPRFVTAIQNIDYQKYLLFYYYGEK